jgi:hypothetical protein
VNQAARQQQLHQFDHSDRLAPGLQRVAEKRTCSTAAFTAAPAAWLTVSGVGGGSKALCIDMSHIRIMAVTAALDLVSTAAVTAGQSSSQQIGWQLQCATRKLLDFPKKKSGP